MATGRTSPALCACEDEAGVAAGDYVVKLSGSVVPPGLLNELLAAKLAVRFGLASPEPAIVMLEPALVELIAKAEPAKAGLIRGSMGANFGTKALTGVSTWPVDKSIPEAMWQAAVDVFAFDALIQNPDRRFDNPNLFSRGDRLIVFDHETAFSLVQAIVRSSNPWRLDDQEYLRHHVFYRKLKSKPIDLTDFAASLSTLSNPLLGDLVTEAPVEWNNESWPIIEQHLRAVRDHAAEFAEEVRRILV